jgi:hypothetical protein
MSIEDLIRSIVRDELAKASPRTEHVTVADYAKSRSISVSTVRVAVRENRLAHIRIGRAVRVLANAEIAPKVTAEAITERARMVLLRGGQKR